MNAANRTVGFALATLSGCLWFVACTPFDRSFLAWIAAVPMLLAIDRAPTLRTALLLGWWAGIVETAGGFYWLIDTIMRFTALPWVVAVLVFLVFCVARGIIFLLFTGVVYGIRGGGRSREVRGREGRARAEGGSAGSGNGTPDDGAAGGRADERRAERGRVARGRPVPMVVLAPVVMAVCEFLVPQIFTCGQWITQAWHPLVIQITELTGPLGVTALLMMVNGALYDFIDGEPAAPRYALAAAAILAAALAFGAIRMREVDAQIASAPRLEIGLVQPNFAYTAEGDFSRDEALRQLKVLQEQSRRLAAAGAQLLVWSEGSYPVALPRTFSADFQPASPAMIRRGFDTPVIIGANTVDSVADEAFNSALLLDGAGRAIGRYDKVQLLAFGEYIPGVAVFPWLADLLPTGTGRFIAGAGPEVFSLPAADGRTWRMGPLICYEDLLPGYIRKVGALHPDLLVNLTSDQWFGARTEPWEHLALSVFASIETRVALVRAVNSGLSALIDPNGRLLDITYANDPYREPRGADGILVSAPKMAGGHTLYIAWGDWFAYVCSAITVALGARAFLGRRGGEK